MTESTVFDKPDVFTDQKSILRVEVAGPAAVGGTVVPDHPTQLILKWAAAPHRRAHLSQLPLPAAGPRRCSRGDLFQPAALPVRFRIHLRVREHRGRLVAVWHLRVHVGGRAGGTADPVPAGASLRW